MKRAAVLVALAGGGCAAAPRAATVSRPVLRVVHQAGAMHQRLVVAGDRWYQTAGDSLLVIDPASGAVQHRVSLAAAAGGGVATELLAHDGRLHVVMRDTAVLTLDVGGAEAPTVARVQTAAALEINARRISLAGDDVFVSGEGGAVRLADGRRMYVATDDVGPVALAGETLVIPVGRRVHRVDDAAYLGAASTLHLLPPAFNRPGQFVFTRRGEGATELGLMTPGIREVNTNTATVRLAGDVHAVAFGSDLVWAAIDAGLQSWRLEAERLVPVHVFALDGVRDLAVIDAHHLVVCGAFGRGLFRYADDGRNPGGVFVHRAEAPGPLEAVQGDGRFLLAFDGRRHWLYDSATNALTLERDTSVSMASAPDRRAMTLDAAADIDDDGRRLRIESHHGALQHLEPERARLRAVVAVGGAFWLAHDRGVTVLDPARPDAPVIDRHALPGPVIFLMPLPDGSGAVYASETGGFGVLSLSEE